MKVSFDFDGTLSEEEVQEYAKELMNKGLNVWVVTTRYDENHKYRYTMAQTLDEDPLSDLWEVVDKLGIPRWKVRFTNMQWKHTYLNKAGFLWHLDDNSEELTQAIKGHIDEMPYMVLVEEDNWKEQCNKLIQKHETSHMSHK
jgi:hypothetical protein